MAQITTGMDRQVIAKRGSPNFRLAPERVVASLNWLSITGLSALYDDAWVAVWFIRRLYSRPNQGAHCHIWWISMLC